jgi:ATP-binding cassette subfamily F protein 3
LSGGERSRLALVRLLFELYNLLLLDEPTNHLDMRSKEILKRALLKYDGTLIIVSHDRDFLDGLVSKVYEFRNHIIRQHIGGIYDWLEKKDAGREQERFRQQAEEAVPHIREEDSSSNGKIRHLERKEYFRRLKKLEKEVAGHEERISLLESELNNMDAMMSNPDPPPGEDFYDRYRQLRESVSKEMSRWEEAHHNLEQYIEDNRKFTEG